MQMTNQMREKARAHAHKLAREYQPPAVDREVRRVLSPGWLRPALWGLDHLFWGRWGWWLAALTTCRPPTGPIPQLSFESTANPVALGMLQRCVDRLQDKGLHYYTAVDYLQSWLLHAVSGTRPEYPKARAELDALLYQAFCLDLLVLYPYDYWGHLLAGVGHGKRSGFYPTPHNVCDAMVSMTFGDNPDPSQTTCDPCVGTGRMLLHASNHTLRLYGQDIDGLVLKACKANLWLYAPWGALPLPDKAWETSSQNQPSASVLARRILSRYPTTGG